MTETVRILAKTGEEVEVVFRKLEKSDLEQAYLLRYSVYSTYGYFSKDWMKENAKDCDFFDKNPSTIHFGAYVGEELIGYVRAIKGPDLPVGKNFDLTRAESFLQYEDGAYELSRLVIKRSEAHKILPRNLIFLFLTRQVLQTCEEEKVQHVFAFITEKLLRRVKKMRMPMRLLAPYSLVYPRDGYMAPYFYEQDIVPVHFRVRPYKRYISLALFLLGIRRGTSSGGYVLKLSGRYVSVLSWFGVVRKK